MSVQYHIRMNDTGRYQVFMTQNGIQRTDVGPQFPTPRSAAMYADTLQEQANEAAKLAAAEWEDD